MANSIINETSSSLVWPEHNRVVSERLHQLYNTGQLVDVAIMAGHNQVFAHRAILAAASPVFLTELQRNTGPYVQIQLDALVEGITGQEMHALIEFIYCGEVCVSQHRLSSFLNIARQFQLVGFHEATQRAIVAPPRSALHVLTLPDPAALSTPALLAPDLQNFLPQLPITMPTFPIADPQQSIPPQLLEQDLVSQEDQFIGSNFVPPESSVANDAALAPHVKYRHQQSEEHFKYCEQFKSDNYNLQNLTGSFTNATFSDLCSTDPDLGLLFLGGDNRSLNPPFRQVCPEATFNGSIPQEDYSQGNVKLPPSGLLNEGSVEVTCLPNHQGFVPVNSNVNVVDWTLLANGGIPGAEVMHSTPHGSHMQQYQIGNHATGCEMQSTPTTNVVPPATVCSSSVPQLTSNLNNSETLVNSYSFTSNSNNSFWVAGGVGSGSTTLGGLGNSIPCGASVATTSSITVTSSCSTTSASNSHHKWCMPDETRNMPELLNCSDSHNGPWSSTGRLKVKSSIGGVSVQDLSRANIQQIRDRNAVGNGTALSQSTQTSKSSEVGHSSKRITDVNSSQTSNNQIVNKISSGKLIVRTDIEAVSYENSNYSVPGTGSKSTGKTASISVVPSEELIDTRQLRDISTTSSGFNKVSIVPEQQLLETNHLATSMQDIVTFDVRLPRHDDLPRITLKKLPLAEDDFSNEHNRCHSETEISQNLECAPIVSNSFLTLSTCSNDYRDSNGLLNEIHTPTQVLNTSLDGDSDFTSDPEEVLVLQESNSGIIPYEHESLDDQWVQVDESFNSQQDVEEDLQVFLTSSHQHQLYHTRYLQSPQMEPVYNDSMEQCEEVTPVKDTAKAQWEMLHQEESRKNVPAVKKHSNSIFFGNEVKVKKGLLDSYPLSRANSPDVDDETVEVVDANEDSTSGRNSVSSELSVLSSNPTVISPPCAISSPIITSSQSRESVPEGIELNSNQFIVSKATNAATPPRICSTNASSCSSVEFVKYKNDVSSANLFSSCSEFRLFDVQPVVSNVSAPACLFTPFSFLDNNSHPVNIQENESISNSSSNTSHSVSASPTALCVRSKFNVSLTTVPSASILVPVVQNSENVINSSQPSDANISPPVNEVFTSDLTSLIPTLDLTNSVISVSSEPVVSNTVRSLCNTISSNADKVDNSMQLSKEDETEQTKYCLIEKPNSPKVLDIDNEGIEIESQDSSSPEDSPSNCDDLEVLSCVVENSSHNNKLTINVSETALNESTSKISNQNISPKRDQSATQSTAKFKIKCKSNRMADTNVSRIEWLTQM